MRQAQKLLRFLGFYRGRTNGIFDDVLKSAVIAFQMKNGIVQNDAETGAGRIGPATQATILKSWKAEIVASKSQSVARKMELTQKVKAEELPKNFLAKGDTGKEVKLLQSFLIEAGYLDRKDATGSYGSRTTAALTKYQIDRSIVTSAKAKGAGVFGPATRLVVSEHLVAQKWQEVREGRSM